MRQRIENKITIDVTGADDLTTVSNLVIWIYQPLAKLEYTPMVVSAEQLLVTIPFEDAMKLRSENTAEIQIAYTDADGNKKASDIVTIAVKRLLDEEGYNGAD